MHGLLRHVAVHGCTGHAVQGLPDHAHKPTLERLPKDMPVVGSPAAARVVADMGFKNVFELDHGQSMSFCEGALTIQATAGGFSECFSACCTLHQAQEPARAALPFSRLFYQECACHFH